MEDIDKNSLTHSVYYTFGYDGKYAYYYGDIESISELMHSIGQKMNMMQCAYLYTYEGMLNKIQDIKKYRKRVRFISVADIIIGN